jgi:hypothetical protein
MDPPDERPALRDASPDGGYRDDDQRSLD